MRILILSHGHPRFSKGGGEQAAYALYEAFTALSQHEVFFVGRVPPRFLNADVEILAIGKREYLLASDADLMKLNATICLDDWGDFATLLRAIQPDVVHFHHYLYLGIELIRVVHRVCPKARIILTLHEFGALCAHHGQMIKTDYQLCYHAYPRDCLQCFPERSIKDFFLRERYLKSFFDLIDCFIAPSRFLAQRYVDWGLSADRIAIQENLIFSAPRLPACSRSSGAMHNRFAYFGRLNPYKGIDLLMESFSLLPRSLKITLDLYGEGLKDCDESFRKRFRQRLNENRRRLHWHGAYDPKELPRLMAGIDWVVLGSIWWENSPLIIQEAFRLGRPVLCPNLGGMAEKVVHEVSSLHFRARDSLDLAHTVQRAATEPGLWERLVAGLPHPPSPEDVIAAHLKLYKGTIPSALRMPRKTD